MQNYPFGIMSMANKSDCLQKGEQVKFQVCTITQTGQKMACNVVPQRRAMVECVKDQVVFSFWFSSPQLHDLKKKQNKKNHWVVGGRHTLKLKIVIIPPSSLALSHTKLVIARSYSSM